MNFESHSLPAKPRIPRYFYILPMAADRILFKMAGRVVSMRGKTVATLLPELLPLLDGQHGVMEIVDLLQGFDAKDIRRTLELMNGKGLLEDAAIKPPPELTQADFHSEQLAFFSHFIHNSFEAQLALQNAYVALIGLGAVGSTVLDALATAGVGHIIGVDEAEVKRRDCTSNMFYSQDDLGRLRCDVVSERAKRFPTTDFQCSAHPIRDAPDIKEVIQGCNLVVVCAEDAFGPLFGWVNQACLALQIPWTSGHLDGSTGIVGPSIIPYQTPCYECYQLRMKGNLEHYEEFIAFEDYLKQQVDHSNHSYGNLGPLPGVVGQLTALEAIKMLTGFARPALYGKLYEMDFLTLRTEFHEILKLPRCPSCGVTRRTPPIKSWSEA